MTETLDSEANLSRVERKRNAVRINLLRTGFYMVAEDGIGGMSINALAEKADCSVGAFYTHFENKDVFIEALKTSYMDPVGDALDHYNREHSTAAQTIAISLRYSLGFAMDHVNWGKLVLATSAMKSASVSSYAMRGLNDINNGIKSGDFDVENPIVALAMMTGSFAACVRAASLGALPKNAPDLMARHLLLAIGVSAAKAKKLTSDPLPDIEIGIDPDLLPL